MTLDIPFLKARWFTDTGSKGRTIDLIVIHSMESAEKGDTAELIARYFSTTTTKASAHHNIDTNSFVQSVKDKDVAYAAPGANARGLHLEHAGRAAQRREQWLDVYSHAMLLMSAKLAAEKAALYKIPVVFRTAADLRTGKARGFTTHHEVSETFGKSSHWDPGPYFPMDYYLDLVKAEMTSGPTIKPEPGGPVVVNAPQVTILSHPSWKGSYLQVHADGGVVNHGSAPFYGSMGGTPLNAPVVDADVTPTGLGYMMVAADGGIFGFGDAQFKGGHGPEAENAAFVSITLTATGAGYWLGGRDGSVWGFGDAAYEGGTEYRGA